MKWLSTYVKEMKIASRGFYFYIEIFVAVIALVILLVAVKENPEGKSVEYLYNDLPSSVKEELLAQDLAEGNIRLREDTELTIRPSSFVLKNKDTGMTESFGLNPEKTVMAQTYQKLNPETGEVLGIVYLLENEEDMIRMSYNTGNIGATTTMDASGNFSYKYVLQGYETARYEEVLYIIHTFANDDIEAIKEQQSTSVIGAAERLNNREAVVPLFIAFSGALMGFFIIMSYVFLDKSQGVIKAFAVTPASVWTYLLTKTLVILTTVIISSSIVVIPIMKLKPNYLLFYVFLAASSFVFSCLGLLVASFFDTISKAFGVLYLIMIGLMLPAFSYYISSFDPLWIRFLPTYPLLEGLKGIMQGQADVSYVLSYTAIFIASGFILLALANFRFKRTLTV